MHAVNVTYTILQIFFNKKLAQAKKYVSEPTQPKLKLKMSVPAEPTPKITFRMGDKASPADSPAPPGIVNGGSNPDQNGTVPRRNPFGSSQRLANNIPGLDQLDQARSLSGSVSSPTPSTSAVVKNEEGPKISPSLPPTTTNYNQSTNAGMTRSSSGLPTNGSSMLPPTNATPGFATSSNITSTVLGSYSSQPLYQATNPNYESKWRQPGKGEWELLTPYRSKQLIWV